MKKNLISMLVSTVMLLGIVPVHAADTAELVIMEQSFAGLTDIPDGWTVTGEKGKNYVFNTDCIGTAAQSGSYVKAYMNSPFNSQNKAYKFSFDIAHYSGSSSFVNIGGTQSSDVISDSAAVSGYSIQFTTKNFKKAVIKLYKNGEEKVTLEDYGANYAYQSLRDFEFTVLSDRVILSGAGNSITFFDDTPIYGGYIGFVLKDSNSLGRSKLSKAALSGFLEISTSNVSESHGVNEDITVDFTCPIDISTVNQTNVYVTDKDGNMLDKSAYSVSGEENRIILSFSKKLKYGADYNVVIGTGLYAYGMEIGLCEQQILQFTTVDYIPDYIPEAALYISSDSTDKYNNYQTVVDEYFEEIDAYRQLNDFTISGNKTFSPQGICFEEGGELIFNNELCGDYIINAALTSSSGMRVIWSMPDDNNYAYIEADASCLILGAVENGETSVLSTCNAEDISGKLTEIRIEISGISLNAYSTIDGVKTELFENITVPFTGGRSGIILPSDGGSVKLMQAWQKNSEVYNGSIDGCVVSYENLGECTIMAGFYNNNRLDSVYAVKADITDEGNNYFTLPVNNTHSLQGLQRKYFIFDSLNRLIPMVSQESVSSYRTGALSDELEPYYQHKTAQTRTTTEMVKRIRGGKKPGVELADEDLVEDELPGGERYAVVDMYKKAGIDLSLDLETYTYSDMLTNSMPQRFSRLTPKSLTGTYDQPYSVDAPWNNKIPEDNPSMLLDSWNSMDMSMQIGTVKNQVNHDGNGIGIPVIIGDGDDPEYTLLGKYGTNTVDLHGHMIKVPENVSDYTNHHTTSDNHAVFINGENKTTIQTMGIRLPGYSGGYSLDRGLVLNYDARATTATGEIDLTGIANEGMTGTNAVVLPMDAFMIRKQELADGGEINHAIAGALGNMMKARTYPALGYDYWLRNTTTTDNTTGNVPYGAVVRISADLPLEELYENGKLSSPAYKLLKAWRDYGFYNIDCSGNAENRIVLYTTTENSDWNYTSPYSGVTGISAIEKEIKAFLAGDEYFGLNTKPLYYLTVPIVKYTELDVTLDGIVDEADYAAVEAMTGNGAELEKTRYDVNKDCLIDEKDLGIITHFLNGTAYHENGDYTVTASYTSGGQLWVDDKNPKHGQWVSISASPNNGYEFVGWEGEFAGETKNVIHVRADRDFEVKAIYKQLDYCAFNMTIEGQGTVKGSTHKRYYTSTVQTQYRANTQMAFLATPAEGWVFDHWEYEGEKHYFDVIDVVIQADTNITAVFRQPEFTDEFDDEELSAETWEAYSTGQDTAQADFVLSGGVLKFQDWDERLMTVTNKNIILSEGEGFELITSGKITATGGGNQGMTLFGYNSENDYYSLDFDKNMIFKLKKTTDGKVTVLKEFEIDSMVNVYEWMTFRLEYSQDTGLKIKLYQNLKEYTLLEGYHTDIPVSGKFGLGSRNCGAVGFDNFILYKESES